MRRRLLAVPIYYGWLVVAVCFLSGLILWGTIWSFGVFFAFLVTEFDLSYANTSIIFSVQSLVTYGGAAVFGVAIDRYGSRRLLVVATGLIIVGLAGTSYLQTFTGVLLSYGVVAATGFGLVFVIAYATPARWFDKRRGLATGIAAAGGGVGTLLVPPTVEVLIGEIGWRGTYVGLTFSFVAILLLTMLIIADRPATLGINPGSESVGGALVEAHSTSSWHEQIGDVLVVVRSPQFLLLFFAYLSFAIPTAMMMVHIVGFTTTEGLGRTLGVLAISLIGAMNVVGKLVGGATSDRLGRPTLIATSGLLMAAAIGVLLTVPETLGILAAAVLFGVGWGFWIGLLAAYLVDLFGTLSINALFGTTMIALAIAAAGAPYAAGLTFDMVGTFRPAFMAGGGLALVGSGLVLVANRVLGGIE